MVDFEMLPKKEEMKLRFKTYSYGRWSPCLFKGMMDYYDYPFIKHGNKPHSHAWGRKPAWRMKRREQRRKKHEKLSTNWDIPTL
jgi:hypothetical protein